MLNEHFFLAIAFAIFAAFFIKYVMPLLLKSAGNRAEEIAAEIAAARQMKEDAQKLLASAEAHFQESQKFAEKIIKDAEEEALKSIEAAKKALAEEMAKKTSATMNRLKTEEEAALRQVKENIVEAAIKNIYSNIGKDLNEKNHENLVAKATENVGK